VKLWLDDIREPPPGYNVWCRSFDEAAPYIIEGRVTHISFDHDLGDVLSGNDVAKLIEVLAHNRCVPRITWRVHSMNPVGRERITQTMLAADVFWGNT
jgi:hypothetical protein